MILLDEAQYPLEDSFQFQVVVAHFPQLQHAHCYQLGGVVAYEQHPVAHDGGSGVYAENDALLLNGRNGGCHFSL